MFDPKILSALKKRGEQKLQKQRQSSTSSPSSSSSSLDKMVTETVSREELKQIEQMEVKNITDTPNLVVSANGKYAKKFHRIFQVDALEAEKMAWMYKAPPPVTNDDIMKKFTDLRFDFEGRLISQSEALSIPVSAGLHHHGDAPQLAGYNLKELFHLARGQTWSVKRKKSLSVSVSLSLLLYSLFFLSLSSFFALIFLSLLLCND